MKALYEKILDSVKSEYVYSKPERIKGSVQHGKNKKKIIEYYTLFYDDKRVTKYQLSVVWFNEEKIGGHGLFLNYKLTR